MIPRPDPRETTSTLRLRRLPDGIAAARPIDIAESFRDLPGLALFESARPGRNARWTYLTADPIAVLEAPAAGPDPFAVARSLVRRLDPTAIVPADAPRFLGGLVGFLGYDLGGTFERLPAIAAPDQDLPPLRLALHDWVVAFDRRTGFAWLGGRALDGDGRRLARRLDDVHARLMAAGRTRPSDDDRASAPSTLTFHSGLSRAEYEAGVQTVRGHIERGDIYQANLTRRLETPFDGDPWELYRRLRTGDPSLFSAYLDLGLGPLSGRPRGLLSASPEPFLSVDADGIVKTDPIKGTRPRGRTREEDRELACELLGSAKDRAENVMIVDVLRNDLGRVCRPGSVRVPRLCRLERTAAVQHLVSTVTGELDDGSRCLRPPRRVVPRWLDHGRPQDPGDGDPREARAGPTRPVHRRAGMDRPGRGHADEHPHPHVRGRRPAAHPPCRWRDHLPQPPGRRMGRDRGQGPRPAERRRGRGTRRVAMTGPRTVWVDGRLLVGDAPHLSAFDRGFQLGDGVFETLRVSGGRPTELAQHVDRLGRSARGLEIALPDDLGETLAAGIQALLAAEGLGGPGGDASVRITVSRGVFAGRGVLPPDESPPPTVVIQAWPVTAAPPGHLEDGLHLATSTVRRDPLSPLAALKTTSRAEYVFARLEARRVGADDALFLTIEDRLSEATSANVFLVRRAADGAVELATPSLDCAILAGTTRSWLLGWAERVGLRPCEAHLTREDLASADEAFLCSSVAGILPVTRFDGAPIGAGRPGPWTRRARDDREAMIRGDGS